MRAIALGAAIGLAFGDHPVRVHVLGLALVPGGVLVYGG